jgi:hypothetical protein
MPATCANLRAFSALLPVILPLQAPASGLETDGMEFATHNFVDRPGQE